MDSQLVESVASRAEELEEASAEELAEELEELVASRAEELEEEREEGLVVNWAAWTVSALGVLWGVSTAVVSGEMWASCLVFGLEFCSET